MRKKRDIIFIIRFNIKLLKAISYDIKLYIILKIYGHNQYIFAYQKSIYK